MTVPSRKKILAVICAKNKEWLSVKCVSLWNSNCATADIAAQLQLEVGYVRTLLKSKGIVLKGSKRVAGSSGVRKWQTEKGLR